MKSQWVMNTWWNNINPVTSEDISRLAKFLQTLAIKSSWWQLRTVVDNVVWGTIVVTQPTNANLNVSAVLSSATVLPDITNIGWISAKQLVFSQSRANYNLNSRSRLSYT